MGISAAASQIGKTPHSDGRLVGPQTSSPTRPLCPCVSPYRSSTQSPILTVILRVAKDSPVPQDPSLRAGERTRTIPDTTPGIRASPSDVP